MSRQPSRSRPDPLDDPFDAAPRTPAEAAEAALAALTATDLAALFGPDGALAGELNGYELRQSQLDMAEAVKRAIVARQHALIEAPTGTGKSIAYLIPAILSGQTVVVSTANKSLQSQLFQKEIPLPAQGAGSADPDGDCQGAQQLCLQL
jgi:ATP-dependent DNA helicase DinG